jgi:uncharacterized protein YbjT (DUF2867 family)
VSTSAPGRVAVVGATGTIGRLVVERLLDDTTYLRALPAISD